MLQRPSYVAYINLVLLMVFIISLHILVFVFAPAIRYGQGRNALNLGVVANSFDRCEVVDEYSLDRDYHVVECQRSNRYELFTLSEEASIVARTPIGTLNYHAYVQQNFGLRPTSGTARISRLFLNDAWVWIVREAHREMRYDDDMNLIWEVNFAWSN